VLERALGAHAHLEEAVEGGHVAPPTVRPAVVPRLARAPRQVVVGERRCVRVLARHDALAARVGGGGGGGGEGGRLLATRLLAVGDVARPLRVATEREGERSAAGGRRRTAL